MLIDGLDGRTTSSCVQSYAADFDCWLLAAARSRIVSIYGCLATTGADKSALVQSTQSTVAVVSRSSTRSLPDPWRPLLARQKTWLDCMCARETSASCH